MQTQTSNALHNAIMESGSKDRPPMLAPVAKGSIETTTKRYMENYKNVSQDIRDQLNVEPEAVQIILTGIDNDIYSTIDACPSACEMWKAIKRLKQGESVNVQDLETNLYWEFGKFTSRDVDACPNACEMWKAIERLKQGESINVQDLETNLFWEFGKFTSLDGESLESYYSRFYNMMNELTRNQCKVTNHQVNVQFLLQLQPEWQRNQCKVTNHQVNVQFLLQLQPEWQRAEKIARIANTLALVAQQQPVYHPQTHPTYYTQNSSTRSQQAATRNRGKAIDKEIDKLMALISLSFKKIYKPTNNNLRTSSSTSRANQDNSPKINKGTRHVARECQKPKRAKDAAYHKEKMLLYQELEAHYMYMAQIQEVTPDAADNSGPIFDTEPLQKVPNNDNYNVFSIETEHPEQSKSVNDTYPIEQDEHNVIIDSWDMSYDREQVNRDDDYDLANEQTSNKDLVDKLKHEIEDFKTKNKCLESSNNHFKEANNELSKTNQLMFKDLKKFQIELDRYHDVKYASKVKINYAKAKEDLLSYKMESEESFNEYTRKINNLNQMISEMKKELFAHQETISILSQEKAAQIKFYKTREDKEID
nr:hypothetical protein [Tanacetum cinerariifolium]